MFNDGRREYSDRQSSKPLVRRLFEVAYRYICPSVKRTGGDLSIDEEPLSEISVFKVQV